MRVALALMLCASALPAQAKTPLVLHHVIARIDSATWREIVDSKFIEEQFAATQAPRADGVDGGALIRFFGKYNFVQFSLPAGEHFRAGDVGIVLASERTGGLEVLGRQGRLVPPSEEGSITTHPSTQRVAYYELSDRRRPDGADSTSDRVKFEFMQYLPEAARRLSASDSLPNDNLSNARFLRTFFDPSKLFLQLTEATLAIPVSDIAKIVRVLQRDGIAVTAQGDGAIITLDGVTLKLVAPYQGSGVKQLQFALTRTALGNPIYRFGPKSQLRFGPGPIAVWDFR